MKSIGPLLAVATILAACGVTSPNVASTTTTSAPSTTSSPSPAAELAAAKQRWQRTGPDTYWLELVDDCGECDPSMREPQTVVVWSEKPVGPGRYTVEALFAQVETAIAEGRNVDVSYHQEMGYPTEISIDMQDRAFDGGHHLLVGDLVAGLPGHDVALDALEEARTIWESSRPEAYEYRTAIHCDCEIDGRILTQVEGHRIVDWSIEYQQQTDTPISPLTIDMMFDDLAEMLSLAEGVEADGVRFTGSAAYDPDLGYPTWIGLDIEILDPGSELAFLPPRLVFTVDQFAARESADPVEPVTELEQARARWETYGAKSYKYELRTHDVAGASFSDPYMVTISDGAVSSVTFRDELVDDYPPSILPVDRLLDYLVERTAAGDVVDGLYHEQLGFPVFIVIHDSATAQPEIFSIHELKPTE